jgi:hypothetical protein
MRTQQFYHYIKPVNHGIEKGEEVQAKSGYLHAEN